MNYSKLQDTVVDMKNEKGVWFGDPCYVVPDHMWGSFCDAWQSFEKQHEENPDNEQLPRCYVAETRVSNTRFFCWSTAYGDGSYKLFVDNKEVASLGVDAGTLSAIPVELLDQWRASGDIGDYERMGHVVDAEHCRGDIHCEGGDLFWGDVRLPTGYEEEEEEEEDLNECYPEGYFYC